MYLNVGTVKLFVDFCPGLDTGPEDCRFNAADHHFADGALPEFLHGPGTRNRRCMSGTAKCDKRACRSSTRTFRGATNSVLH